MFRCSATCRPHRPITLDYKRIYKASSTQTSHSQSNSRVKMSKRPAQFGTSSSSSSKKSIVWTLFDNNCIDATKVTCKLCNDAMLRGRMKKAGIGTTDQRHPPPRCNRSAPPPLILVAAAASGALDLSVTLRHVRS